MNKLADTKKRLILSQIPSERNAPYILPIQSRMISECGDICQCRLPRISSAIFQEEYINSPLRSYHALLPPD